MTFKFLSNQSALCKKIYNPETKKDTTKKDEMAELFKTSQEEIFLGNETIDHTHENNVNDWYNHENFNNIYQPTEHFEPEKNIQHNQKPKKQQSTRLVCQNFHIKIIQALLF